VPEGPASGAPDAAFAQLYEDYFGSIYDFSIRLAQDREIAALVVQSSFLRVYRALRSGETSEQTLQLYSGAHNDTAERLSNKRGDKEQVEEPYAALDTSLLSGPVEDAQDLGRMVWSAAIDLKLNDYELLDLNIRRQLSVTDIGAVLAVRPESVERRLADASNALQQALTARLLFARGRRECIELDFQLGEAEWSSSQSRRVLRHADSCRVCQGALTGHPDARDLFTALMPVPAPATWKATILERLQEAARNEPIPTAAPLTPVAAAPAPDPQPDPDLEPTPEPSPAPTQPEEPSPSPTPVSSPASAQTQEVNPTRDSSLPEPQRLPRPLPEFGSPGRGGGGQSSGGGTSIGDRFESIFGGGGPRGPLLAALLGGLLAIAIVIGSLCAAGTFSGDGDDDEPEPVATVTATPTTDDVSGTPTVTTTPTQTPTLEPAPQPTFEPPLPTDEPPEPTATAPLATATVAATLEATATLQAPTEPALAPTEPIASPTP
jgi:DNA-directed RNA polymerase specialized sigma24 family protein